MRSSMLTMLLLVVVLMVFACHGHAQQLTLIAEDARPNSFKENGKVTGRAAEIVQAVLKEIGMEDLAIEIYPWTRGYLMLETGTNIALFPTSRTTQREKLFKWAGPIFDNEVNLYKLKSRQDIQPETLEDLKKYKAGSAGGHKNMKTQFLISHGFDVEVVDQDKQNIEKLFLGRVDFIPYAEVRFNYDVRKSGHDPDQIEKIWNIQEMSSQAFVAFSKSIDDELVKKFQQGFDAIKEKGIQEKILSRWE